MIRKNISFGALVDCTIGRVNRSPLGGGSGEGSLVQSVEERGGEIEDIVRESLGIELEQRSR